jgi:hypothetical protein
VPGPATDPSYDWHGQVIVPFGVLLKSSPVPLHEVLLFHDEAPGAATPVAATPVAATPVAATPVAATPGAAARAATSRGPVPGAPVQGGPVPDAPVPSGPVSGGTDPESKDCYAIDGTPPRLLGQTPDAYLLCFDHDRLNRIESTVHLAPATAAQVFAQACASWLSGAAATLPTAGVCEGRSGTTSFAAHLVLEPGESATLSLVLSNANTVP